MIENKNLKLLKFITDTELVELGFIKYPNTINALLAGRKMIEDIDNQPRKVIDYLRFKKYALPFMDKSVDELIESGAITIMPVFLISVRFYRNGENDSETHELQALSITEACDLIKQEYYNSHSKIATSFFINDEK